VDAAAQQPFETAIIARYRRWEATAEEALAEMYLAGISVRRVENIRKAQPLPLATPRGPTGSPPPGIDEGA
jgi:transposase-like protein